MGTLADITDLVSRAYDAWSSWRAESGVSPRKLFAEYVTPSYNLLKEIHGDYFELYLELRERMELADDLDFETLQWFSKARRLRQVDRSELRLADCPTITGEGDRIRHLNEASMYYFKALRSYFIPEHKRLGGGEGRIYGRIHERSTSLDTEEKLTFWYFWKDLAKNDRFTILTEEYLNRNRKPIEFFDVSDALEDLMRGALGGTIEGPDRSPVDISLLEEERTELLVRSLFGELAPTETLELDRYVCEDYAKEKPSTLELRYLQCKHIMLRHIGGEMVGLERKMKNVQQRFVRLRIQCDQF